jgi:hypothetical protein
MNTLPRDRYCVCSGLLSRSSRRYCSPACRSLIAEFYEFSTLQFILINLRCGGANQEEALKEYLRQQMQKAVRHLSAKADLLAEVLIEIVELQDERMKTHKQIFRAASATRSEPQPGTPHRLLCLSLLLLALSTNCDVLQGAVPILGRLFPGISGKMEKQAESLVEVQDSLLRFADEYSTRMVGGVDNLRRGTEALSPAEVLQLKIAIGSGTWSIACGSNVVANLIDMTVFVTVMRMTLEDYWQPKVFGKSALPMLAYSRSAEADIWKLAGKVLNA